MSLRERTVYNRTWYQANRDRVRVRTKAFYQANRERILVRQKNNREKINVQRKARKQKNKERKFEVSYPTWWLCDICDVPISGSGIVLDHDHKTGRFRGWLCRQHNALLGGFGDSIEGLERAISYLRR